MPFIMITSAITTVFEVPDGVDLLRVRQLGLSELGDDEDATDSVSIQHDKVMNEIYLGRKSNRHTSPTTSLFS